jgi:hypothetical protein
MLEQMLSQSPHLSEGAKAALKSASRAPGAEPMPTVCGDSFPMTELLQYADSEAVKPYIQAKMCMFNGLHAIMEQQDWIAGLSMLAEGAPSYTYQSQLSAVCLPDHAQCWHDSFHSIILKAYFC